MAQNKLCPFLKWPGGKRWLMENYGAVFPTEYSRYFEPFLGGGAVFFNLLPNEAILSDINPDLINVYTAMRDYPVLLGEYMRDHHMRHCKEYYYLMRDRSYDDPIKEASRFLYLNRTCYNGMYRVNKQGKFNVPIGTKTNCIYDISSFDDYSEALNGALICIKDFEEAISEAGDNDLVFADPPYATPSKDNFVKYNESLFTWNDQERLCKALTGAKERGAFIIATNANYKDIKQMYSARGFFVKVVQRYSVIASKTTSRGKQKELLISSRPFPKRARRTSKCE